MGILVAAALAGTSTHAGTGTLMGTSDLAAFFWETGSLASAIPQVIELRTSYMSVAHHFDLVNSRRSKQERALYPDAMRCDASHREIRVVAAFAHPYYRSAKFLNAFTLALTNTQMNAYVISGPQLGDVLVYRGFERFNYFGHRPAYSIPAALGAWAARGKSIPRAAGVMIWREFRAWSQPTANRRAF